MELGGLRGERRVLLLFFILIPGGLQTSLLDKQDLYINYTIRTWEDASRSCSLVGSDRSPSYVDVKDIPVVQDKYRGGTPHKESLYWIGATATFTPLLELLGCQVLAPVNTIHILTNRSPFIGPVADCYLKCDSDFGVNATHCYCARKLGQEKFNTSCNLTTAKHFPIDIIGTKTNDNYHHLAMYKVLASNLDFKVLDELGECLINTTTGEMTTYPCDAADSSKRTWTGSVLAGLPLNGSGPKYWTQLTRRRLVHWTKGNATVCATVREANHEYEILLRPCDEARAYICQRKPDSKNEVSPHSHHMATPSSLVTSREKTNTTTNFHVIATTTVATHNMLPNTENGYIYRVGEYAACLQNTTGWSCTSDCYLERAGSMYFGINVSKRYAGTHCYCSAELDKGTLNVSCKLNTSVHFPSDIIGINNLEDY